MPKGIDDFTIVLPELTDIAIASGPNRTSDHPHSFMTQVRGRDLVWAFSNDNRRASVTASKNGYRAVALLASEKEHVHSLFNDAFAHAAIFPNR
jgi:hypothetical protein